jgi:hypothetical protein
MPGNKRLLPASIHVLNVMLGKFSVADTFVIFTSMIVMAYTLH